MTSGLGAGNKLVITIMLQGFGKYLHSLELVVLGMTTTLLLFAQAGAVYEWTHEGPSDGFLFDLLVFGFPLLLIGPVFIGWQCEQHPRFRWLCRIGCAWVFARLIWTWAAA